MLAKSKCFRVRTYRHLPVAAFFWAAASASHAQQNRPQDLSDFQTAKTDAVIGTSPSGIGPLPTIGGAVPSNFFISQGTLIVEGAAKSDNSPGFFKIFNLNVLTPMAYTDNNGGGSNNESQTATPEVKIGYSDQPWKESNPFQGSFYADLSSNRVSGSQMNADRLSGQMRFDWVGVKNSGYSIPGNRVIEPWTLWHPSIFFSYTPQQSYTPLFERGGIVTQDYAVGLTGFLQGWMNGQTPANWYSRHQEEIEVDYQAQISHRVTDAGPDSYALVLGPSVKLTRINDPADSWLKGLCQPNRCSSSLGLNVTRRWYDALPSTDQRQRSWSFNPVLTGVYVFPQSWFGAKDDAQKLDKGFGQPEVDFQAGYSDTISSMPSKNDRLLSVGITFKAAWGPGA
jgi:hypothetical protein